VITVLTPVSPIPAHPDIAMLEQTLDSIRHHLPDAEVILTFDGVRAEQADRAKDYAESIRRTLWRADHHYGNICPLIFDEHTHQAGMARAALAEVRTPLVLYVEQDTPLVTDLTIDFTAIAEFIMAGRSDLVRLHHEAVIPVDHAHLMHGHEEPEFLRTSQWSQRPHVAAVAYYRRVLADHFSPDARCFIEDKMHGVVQDAWYLGNPGQHRLHIWHPDGGNVKRSYHLDGRAGGDKFETEQSF
jgi:hypothetical protein